MRNSSSAELSECWLKNSIVGCGVQGPCVQRSNKLSKVLADSTAIDEVKDGMSAVLCGRKLFSIGRFSCGPPAPAGFFAGLSVGFTFSLQPSTAVPLRLFLTIPRLPT